MPFPAIQRVIYERNPLEQVICQVRFPPILRIEAEIPVRFQERLRDRFPLFRENTGVDFGPDVPQELAKLVPVGARTYEFTSKDGKWTATLSRDFVALTTRQYERWEQFRDNLRGLLDVLVDVYKPSFYSRVGLRYRDLIDRENLTLVEAPWSKLLQPAIAAELSASGIADEIEHAAHEILVRLPGDHGHVRLKHGLLRSRDVGKTCYVIDADFFTEVQTEIDDVHRVLDEFNRQAGRLFRWCITDDLHAAMGPRPVT